MKNSRNLKYNPTEFFFKQAENPPEKFDGPIQEFVSKLFSDSTCVLCKEKFNLKTRIPRILIHCGHTFCECCLKKFHKNLRVRCPLCLKLVKNIDILDRLPINHTIFHRLAEEHNKHFLGEGQVGPQIEEDARSELINPGEFLYSAFANARRDENDPGFKQVPAQMVLKMMFQNYNPAALQNNYMDSNKHIVTKEGDDVNPELEYCEEHLERVKHFYCIAHQTITCRVCTQIGHNKEREECMIVDLYEVDDMPSFLKQASLLSKQNHGVGSGQMENMNVEYDDDDEDEDDDDDDDDEGIILKRNRIEFKKDRKE